MNANALSVKKAHKFRTNFYSKVQYKIKKGERLFHIPCSPGQTTNLGKGIFIHLQKVKSFFVQKGDRYKKKERKLHAVITIEAALTIPLFFLAGVMLIYLLEVQATRISVKMGADTAAKKSGGANLSCSGAPTIKSRVRYCRSNWAETVKPKYDCW